MPIWNLNLQDVKTQIKCYTESEAPYYYFDNEGIFKSVESVAVMDIGGGSTDFVYYSNGIPQMANSVHFGCDIIWGNAYNKYENAKGNETDMAIFLLNLLPGFVKSFFVCFYSKILRLLCTTHHLRWSPLLFRFTKKEG